MRFPAILPAALVLTTLGSALDAQERERTQRERVRERVSGVRVWGGDDEERAALGVHTASSGERDTLGLLIVGIVEGGPAEKAGLEEGNRIAAVNGVNLRLAAADAGESDMQGVATRRLVRELRKVEPGAEVELRVYANGQFRNMKVKTVAAEDLPTGRRMSDEDRDDRAVVGLQLSATGSRRDTLGVFVTRVESDGPAEKAGIVEGDRIAAINGVNLRVSREDAEEGFLSGARANRFSRELRKVKAGDEVELRVYSAGQYKTVKVKTARAEDVYSDRGGMRFFFGGGDGFGFASPNVHIAPIPPIPPMPPMERFRIAPEARTIVIPRITRELNDAARAAAEEAEVAARAATAAAAEAAKVARDEARAARAAERQRTLRRQEYFQRQVDSARREPVIQSASSGAGAGGVYRLAAQPRESGFVAATASGEGATLDLNGLRLAIVGDDLADYLGEGSDRGLLVVEAEKGWKPLRAGDVILAVNGEPVREGAAASIVIDSEGVNELTLLRRGELEKIELDCGK